MTSYYLTVLINLFSLTPDNDKIKAGELLMISKMSSKPIIVLACLSFVFLVTFQNCSSPKNATEAPQYGKSESSSVLSSEKDVSVLNLPALPTHYGNLTTGLEIYGNCVIANTSRDFVMTVNERSAKSECASKCNDNLIKFPGDKIQCTFPGGLSNTSIDTSKNYCRIVVGEKDVKLDSYALDLASCKTQCQIVGKDLDKTIGLVTVVS